MWAWQLYDMTQDLDALGEDVYGLTSKVEENYNDSQRTSDPMELPHFKPSDFLDK